MNVDITGMNLPNAFDFNSTKYDCNWASLATASGAGLMVAFDASQRFHCHAGAGNGGNYVLYVNQQVSLPNDSTTPVVPDLIMTLSSGAVVQGSFQVGSVSAATNAVASISNLAPGVTRSSGSDQFGLTFGAVSGASFSVWSSTNLVDWTWAGAASESTSGHYAFVDPASTASPSSGVPWPPRDPTTKVPGCDSDEGAEGDQSVATFRFAIVPRKLAFPS